MNWAALVAAPSSQGSWFQANTSCLPRPGPFPGRVQQAKTGNIGDCFDAANGLRRLGRRPIEPVHRGDHAGHVSRIGQVALEGGADGAGAQRLGQHQYVAWFRSALVKNRCG